MGHQNTLFPLVEGDDSFENYQSDNQHGDTCFDSWYSGCREPRTNGSASKNCRNEIARYKLNADINFLKGQFSKKIPSTHMVGWIE